MELWPPRTAVRGDAIAVAPCLQPLARLIEERTLLYVSHTTPHTTLHLNKIREAIRQRKLPRGETDTGFRGLT